MLEFLHRVVLPSAVCGALLGCGAGFDPPSELKGLRVLAVQKDNPYPRPGDTVNLQMLWHDGTVDPLDPEPDRRDIQVTWITGCTNPLTESFYGCIPQFADPSTRFSTGDSASLVIDPGILQSISEPRPGQPRIGRSFVFFAACAGQLGVVEEPSEEGALPLVCRDGDGAQLGPDSFVVGYSTLFTYADPNADGRPIENSNPLILGFRVGATDVEDFCIDGECLGSRADEAAEIDCDATPDLCFPTCVDDGDPTCPEIDIRPVVDLRSAEVDEAAKTFFGHDFQEQMWINYYVDRGGVRGDGVRLLNDATKGWNDDYGTDFYAPKEPGPVTIWAVAHDDRGGQSWIRTRIQIREP